MLRAENIGLRLAYEQWGNAGNSGGSVDVTFPISFTKTVYQIQLTYNSSSYENPTYAIKDTKSFSYWCKYGGDKLWLAVGMQQWGTWKVGDSAWHPFPISFSKACYQIVCAININDSGNMSKNRVFVSSYDNNGFNIAAYGQGIRMIAIGV